MKRRLAQLTLLSIVVALAAVIGISWQPLYLWVFTKRITAGGRLEVGVDPRGNPFSGWYSQRRWGMPHDLGPAVYYYLENGLKMREEFWYANRDHEWTEWNVDGIVRLQLSTRWQGGQSIDEERLAPAWWWGRGDQNFEDANQDYSKLRRVDTENGRDYYWNNGLRAVEVHLRDDGLYSRCTMWNSNGRVCWQSEHLDSTIGGIPKKRDKYEPPWWWGVTDQRRSGRAD